MLARAGSLDGLMSATTTPTPTILRITPEALEKVVDLKAAEDDADSLGLRIEVTGTSNGDYTYDLAFEPVAEAAGDDAVYTQGPGGELTVMIPVDSVDSLRGATLDLPSSEGQPGLVLRNPNKPDPLAGINLELTGDVADRITQLLDQQVNPALASHGGFAELKGVDGSRAFVLMGGGCQGCAVSAMTLRDGIERAIKENVPEITEVVDATDHAAGENPFYEENPY